MDLPLNNLEQLICLKTKTNQTKQMTYAKLNFLKIRTALHLSACKQMTDV